MRELSEMDLRTLKDKLNGLSTATEKPVVVVDRLENGDLVPNEAKNYKAIVNDRSGEIAAVVSKGYKLIQHKDAFGAVIDSLVAVNPDARVRATLCEYGSKAWMSVVFRDFVADDGAEGIELGFNVKNSFDKTSSLQYGGNQSNVGIKVDQHYEPGRLEFFGRRLACNNGMIVPIVIKASLNERGKALEEIKALNVVDKLEVGKSQVGDVVMEGEREVAPRRWETIRETRELVKGASSRIRHYGNVEMKMDAVQDMFNTLPLVCDSLSRTIRDIQEVSVTEIEAESILSELGFADRVVKKILKTHFEEGTQWGLYNAVTSYATHEEKVSFLNMENTLRKAEPLLMKARA